MAKKLDFKVELKHTKHLYLNDKGEFKRYPGLKATGTYAKHFAASIRSFSQVFPKAKVDPHLVIFGSRKNSKGRKVFGFADMHADKMLPATFRPTKYGSNRYGKYTFYKTLGDVEVREKKYPVYLPKDRHEILSAMARIDASIIKKSVDRRRILMEGRMQRSTEGPIKLIREKINMSVAAAIHTSLFHAQEELLKEMQGLIGWKNLTGNAYTGLVSMIYYNTRFGSSNKMRSVAEAAGKKRRGTRKMLRPGAYRNQSSSKERKRGVFFGRRYDTPDSWFSILDRGQFFDTTGHYAYDDAKQILETASQGGAKSRNTAFLRLASGAPYIATLDTNTGQGVLETAMQISARLVNAKIGQYLKNT